MSCFIDGSYPEEEMIIKSGNATTEKEEMVNPDYIQWEDETDFSMAGSFAPNEEVRGLGVGFETSAEVWKALAEHFARNLHDREFYLTTELTVQSRRNFESINDYIRVFEEVCDELNIGPPIPRQQKYLAS